VLRYPGVIKLLIVTISFTIALLFKLIELKVTSPVTVTVEYANRFPTIDVDTFVKAVLILNVFKTFKLLKKVKLLVNTIEPAIRTGP
jgi:hypothetical protein